jgi:hypothetical protein
VFAVRRTRTPVESAAAGGRSSGSQGGNAVVEKKGKGSDAAKRANAKAGAEGKSNPRKSSAAQAELGKKGGKSKSS